MDRPVPTLENERRLWNAGYRCIAGLDEAGRGALAGPVVAGAVIIAPDQQDAAVWTEVRDSKLLTPRQRGALARVIERAAQAWAIGWSTADAIDRTGIAAATRHAMLSALRALPTPPDYLLIDWVKLPAAGIPQLCQPRADSTMVSVAAASILAKVWRDRHMVELDVSYPAYGFARHKGYGAAAHLAALRTQGPCAAHRQTFAPMATLPLFAQRASEHCDGG